MNQGLYEQFIRLKNLGLRQEAKLVMSEFIQSFKSFDEKQAFTDWFFENEFDGQKVRHELYDAVLLPVLTERYKQSDPLSVKRLALTEQNLYQSKSLPEYLERKTKISLLREYLSLCPEDNTVRFGLLEEEISYFRHCEHEWPAGILYGMDGATPSECDELLVAVSDVRKLDIEGNYTEYIHEFEQKVRSYRDRIL